jgi:hypothetical protein
MHVVVIVIVCPLPSFASIVSKTKINMSEMETTNKMVKAAVLAVVTVASVKGEMTVSVRDTVEAMVTFTKCASPGFPRMAFAR